VGGALIPYMVQFSPEARLPDADRARPEFQQIVDLVTKMVMYTNDLYSYRAGRDVGKLNWIYARQREAPELDAEQIERELAELCVATERELGERLKRSDTSFARSLIECLKGIRNYHRSAQRYKLEHGK